MKRSRWSVILLFTATSVVLLCFQITLLRHAFEQPKKQPWTIRPQDPHLAALANLRAFIRATTKEHVPVIPLDPSVLTTIASGNLNNPCPLLCTKVIIFATFSKFINHKPSFLEEVEVVGFEVLRIEGPNPRLLPHGYQVAIPLHYILIRWNIAIHVVVLYERESGYWWHTAIILNELQIDKLKNNDVLLTDFTLPLYDRAVERFEVIPSHLWGMAIHLPHNIPAFLENLAQSRFVECNHTRARLFRDKHKHDGSNEALEFRSDAWRLLSRAKQLLDSLGVSFWLSSGTCLGYFRQCDIISYSKDVDIGIWIEDFNPHLISLLSSHGLPVKHIFGRVNDSFELSFQDGDIKLDMFFFYHKGDQVWNGGTQARTGKKFKYLFPEFSLCWTEFLELKVRVPCETEQYILANYGVDWFVPVKSWDWKRSPPNVRANGVWPEEDWPQVIRVFQHPGHMS